MTRALQQFTYFRLNNQFVRILQVILIAITMLIASTALAALLQADQEDTPSPTPAVPTATSVNENDQAIAAELQSSLDAIDGIENVLVSVQAGIATIEGDAATTEAIERATTVAEKVDGIRAVENNIELTRDVGRRLAPVWDRIVDHLINFVAYLPLLLLALLIILAAWIIGRRVSQWDWPFQRFSANAFVREIIQRVAFLVILLAGVLFALDVLDATAVVGGVLGAAGVAGIAIGFAFRDLIENYIASILLSVRQPFRPNDHVVIDGNEGLVTRLTTRSTTLTTFDGNVLRIPNAVVFKATILNYSLTPERRFTFTVGVGTDVDLSFARKKAMDVLKAIEGVLADPEPMVLVKELGDSNVALQMFGWVNQTTHSFLRVRSLAVQRIKEAFDEHDIDMPEPIYRVRMQQVEPGRQAPAEVKVAPTPTETTDAEVLDTSVDETAQETAERNRTIIEGQDLLSEDAPKE